MVEKPKATIPLAYPIVVDGKEVSELTFRRAKIKDIEAIQNAVEDGGELHGSITTISALTGIPIDAVREIDADDYITIAERVADFLPKTPAGSSAAAEAS